MTQASSSSHLKRQLGLVAVMAVVSGDMLGSGIFYTPQELAPVAQSVWQVYFFWALCGLITLCGVLTVGELGARMPRSGADYHIIRTGFGGLFGFVKVWSTVWVAGPGSVAAVAILFGKFVSELSGVLSPVLWGVAAVVVFTVINLMGVQWGGRTQIVLTAIKLMALLALVFGSLIFAEATEPADTAVKLANDSDEWWSFFRLMGLGIAAVLFTYDGWIDIVHAAGEVKNPQRNLPIGLTAGVVLIIAIYLLANFAFLRVVPLHEMARSDSLAAVTVARKTFGNVGGQFITVLMMISILGALGGLVMTFPRLIFAAGSHYTARSADESGLLKRLFRFLGAVSSNTQVPFGAILLNAVTAVTALVFFQSFSRIVNFFVVPNQLFNILLVASIFRLPRDADTARHRMVGYPIIPLIYIVTIAGFLVGAFVYNPVDTAIGLALAATGVPVYLWLERKRS
tara:strand:- start:1019 stop:2386 length:1368 start_codon:yes stop_codon:yes gene_type:complete